MYVFFNPSLTPEKEVNPMSQFLITILAEVARMERKTIRERVASGYDNYRNAVLCKRRQKMLL